MVVFAFATPTAPPWLADVGFVIIPGYVPIGIALIAYFMYVLFKKSDVAESVKMLWTVLLLMWFPLTSTVFWYRFIWKRRVWTSPLIERAAKRL